jgi:hypothetical protein
MNQSTRSELSKIKGNTCKIRDHLLGGISSKPWIDLRVDNGGDFALDLGNNLRNNRLLEKRDENIGDL